MLAALAEGDWLAACAAMSSVGGITMPSYQDIGAAQSSLTGITVAWPTHATDDIALLVCSSGGTEPVTLATANGFAAVADSPQDTGVAASSGVALSVFWCRATSAAMAAPVTNDSGNHQHGFIITFRWCVASGNPWDVTAGDFLDTVSTTVTIPGDTTTVANCLVVAICGHSVDDVVDVGQFSGWANADLANITERFDNSTAVGGGSGLGIVTGEKAAAGAYAATTATLATTSRQARMSIALKGLGA